MKTSIIACVMGGGCSRKQFSWKVASPITMALDRSRNQSESREGREDPERRSAVPGIHGRIGFWLGLGALLFVLLFVEIDSSKPALSRMAAVTILMAIWWMTEAVPIAVTALVPLILFPTLGIMRGEQVAPVYVNSNIFLFAGGFLIALAMQRWNLHKRIALLILDFIGGHPHRLVLGFMVATGFLSMWISNTATAMMMMPMGLSLVLLYEDLNRQRSVSGIAIDPRAKNFSSALMLGIAYGASIGGFATIIGTPPNVVLVSIFESEFPGAAPISFAQWVVFALPLSVTFMFLAWAVLCRVAFPLPAETPFSGRQFIRETLRDLGPYRFEEKLVTLVFGTAGFLWMFRREISFGESFRVPGWSTWLQYGDWIDDGTIGITMGVVLFLLPTKHSKGRLMDWDTAKRLPWGVLWLFGGGFALARGFTVSGLSDHIGQELAVLKGAPVLLVIAVITATITLVTELTSNTATTQMILPIMASLARSLHLNPLLLLIPAALAASCAFMLPVATPPNAVVYGSERVPIGHMIRAGVLLNLVGIILIVLFVYLVLPRVFDIQISPLL